MTDRLTNPSVTDRLDSLSLAFVVGGKGTTTDKTVADLVRFAQSKKIVNTIIDVEASLDRAKRQFAKGFSQFFLCDGEPCRRRRLFDAAPESLRQAAHTNGCSMTMTDCQGPCKYAPVATLRIGANCHMFTQFAQVSQWQAVMEFVKTACAVGTLQLSSESIEPFLYSPDHVSEKPCPALLPLRFLIGHFEGMIDLPEERRSIQKEVTGSWEVDGRFIALRMGVKYRRQEDSRDRHHALMLQALVLVGSEAETGGFNARVYTDSGEIQDFRVEMEGSRLWLADRVPHGVSAVVARKVLSPTPDGYDESLEIDRGEGRFDPYYTIPLRRTARNGSMEVRPLCACRLCRKISCGC